MASNKVNSKSWLLGLQASFVLALVLVLGVEVIPQATQQATSRHRKIMIVGVAHLVAKNDLHNSSFDDPLGAERQKQIAELIGRLAAFHPTKVMIEQPFGDAKIQERYKQYVKGAYQLGANEIYQFGFRLAALSKNSDIYPVDTTQDFPFDYDTVKESAKRNNQSALLVEADARSNPHEMREQQLTEKDTMRNLVRYLNTDEAIDGNASWYLYADRIGSGNDYAGAQLVSNWYSRNLYLFANILHLADSPDDRIVVFIGAGHVKLLRDCVRLSPDLEFIDPKPYLDKSPGGH